MLPVGILVTGSTSATYTNMSIRNASPGMLFAFASRAVTVIDDCDAPSWLMLSGVAVRANDSASSDGPVSDGIFVSETLQAELARASTAPRINRRAIGLAIGLKVPKIAEVDLNRPGGTDGVADMILTVERDVRDGRKNRRARDQRRQRRLLLGHNP